MPVVMWRLSLLWSYHHDQKCTERQFFGSEKPTPERVMAEVRSIVEDIVRRYKTTCISVNECTLMPCGQQEQINLDFLRGL